MAKDPVCKMQVDEQTASVSSSYKGQTYYFCTEGCRQIFDADPEKFLQTTDLLGRKVHPD